MSDFTGDAAAREIRAALARCNAGAAFGLPGGANQMLFQALRTAATRLIVPSHELAAAFMAGTYGRVDGRPGILLTIPGPGFAYALAGIAEAWQDSAPLVHIVSAPPEGPHQRHRHQALNQTAIVRPMAKAVFGASELAQLGDTICAAFETARGGEPGPVVVELGAAGERLSNSPGDDERETSVACAIWERIQQAHKPVLLLGQGCAGSAAVIDSYVQRTATPVFTTASGRGVISESSPWCLGYDGLRGSTGQLNTFLREADLVIAIGARLAFNGTAGFSVTLPPERLVHIDAGAANLNAVYPASKVAAISVKTFFALPGSESIPRSAWTLETLAAWRTRISAVHRHDPEPTIMGGSPQQFFGLLRAALPDDALVVTDSGLHQVLARRYFEVRHVHGLLLPTDLQSMGFALPSAIAAKLAAPNRQVVALVGDGGMLMSGLELAVAVREKLALTVIVFNDGYLNQIRLQQLRDRGRGYGVVLPVVDFKALADAVGATYVAAGDSGAIESIGRAARRTGVTLLEVPVTDGASFLATAAKGKVRAALRGALGPRRWGVLKHWLHR